MVLYASQPTTTSPTTRCVSKKEGRTVLLEKRELYAVLVVRSRLLLPKQVSTNDVACLRLPEAHAAPVVYWLKWKVKVCLISV